MGSDVVGPDVDDEQPVWNFVPTDPNCGLKTFIGEAIGAASMCWETPEGAGIFDSTRAKAIADAVYERAMSPRGARLGMASTGQLLDEIRTRLEICGEIDYRTVDDDRRS